MDKFISIQEAAKVLSMSPMTVNRMCISGKLPAVKIGKLWRIDASALTIESLKNRNKENNNE